MRNLKDIVKRAREGPGLMFRAEPYDLENPDDFLADITALANADIVGQRALIIGVTPGEPGTRRVQALETDSVPDASTIWALIEKYIEPGLAVKVLAPGKGSRTLLVILIDGCDDPPYLLKRSCGVLLKGAGFVRRQDQNFPLGREESNKLRNRHQSDGGAVRNSASADGGGEGLDLTFPGGMRRQALAATPDDGLPSALATRKLESAIASRKEVQAMKGLDTAIVRLMHVRAFGQEQPFAKKSIEELEDDLRAVRATFSVEDKYHLFEKTAHRINFVLQNSGERAVKNLILRVRIQRVRGLDVAPCIYTTEIDSDTLRRVLKDTEDDGYPKVRKREHFFDITSSLDQIDGQSEVPVFSESLRMVVRETAAGQKILISYELESDDLEGPLNGTLELRLTSSAGR